MLQKLPHWKAPGKDGLQGYWIKAFKSLHDQLLNFLNLCLQLGKIPDWMVWGKTVLILKDLSKRTIPSNYRPITCLPNIWKILTGIISDKMYESLDETGVLIEDQKGCKKGARVTNGLIFIDKMVLKEAKRTKKDLAICWIDYRKAYDMVPHSWIMECLTMFKIANNVQNLLQYAMPLWKAELTSNNQNFCNVAIKRGIFQGDSLSPLLFIIGLIPLTLILRKYKKAYEFSNRKERINHVLYMDNLKLYGKTDKVIDSLIEIVGIFSSDIAWRGIKDENCDILLPNDLKISSLKAGEN